MRTRVKHCDEDPSEKFPGCCGTDFLQEFVVSYILKPYRQHCNETGRHNLDRQCFYEGDSITVRSKDLTGWYGEKKIEFEAGSYIIQMLLTPTEEFMCFR
jgi:hypothetical protein